MEQRLPNFSMLSDEFSDIANAISNAQDYMLRMEKYVSSLSTGLVGCRNSIAILNERVKLYEQNYYMLHSDNISMREKIDILNRVISKYQVADRMLRANVERLEKNNRGLQCKLQEAQMLSTGYCRRATLDDLATAARLEESPTAGITSHFSEDTDSTNGTAISTELPPFPANQQQDVPAGGLTLHSLQRKMRGMNLPSNIPGSLS
uniref:Uncharacterized protein n=1 Tax=Talaromyces marneffei PM1 TaxID=1077442 RepID=A0A093URL9_TALMA